MGEILEYPYVGEISRPVQGSGREADNYISVYEGMMDLTLNTADEGRTLQTATYIVSIPLTKNDNGEWIVPHKGDMVKITRYGETLDLVVDNAEPSQLGGVSIYTTRKSW